MCKLSSNNSIQFSRLFQGFFQNFCWTKFCIVIKLELALTSIFDDTFLISCDHFNLIIQRNMEGR